MKTAREILCKHMDNLDDKWLDESLVNSDDALSAMKEYANQFIELAAKKGEEEAPVHLSGNITYAVLKIKELVK